MIDLHIHSTASDGSLTPAEIIDMALSKGLSAIAITDHDTVEGVREAVEAGIPYNLEFMTGVELSAQPLQGYEESASIHILGYGFSIYDRQMNVTLERLKDARAHRNPRILAKLDKLGFPLTMNEVIRICGQGQMGRPHIARAMVEKGYVKSFDDAFDRYLAKGGGAYVDKFRLSCKDAIRLILDAGGIPVLAHPGIIKTTEDYPVDYLISQLIGMGLMGIEVFHTDHTEEQTSYLAKLASKKGLLATGGSDFHGKLKQGVEMGSGNGNLDINHDHYRLLYTAVDRSRTTDFHISKLEDNLSYIFSDKSLLLNALRHSSYVNEVQEAYTTDNQRLEFLGDAVLGLAIGQILMKRFPEMREGELSKLRSTLVSESGLAAMARQMDIGRFISLGKGERLSRGAEKNSILADTFEAIIAAIYLDLGFENTYDLIESYFDSQISQIASKGDNCDYKSMLQELVQDMGNFTPCYTIVKESGPDHDKTFDVVLNVCDMESSGSGKSKKAAEQNAAANALVILRNNRESMISEI
ncbi:MAG: ribonuclease III [Desulfamplus sp.]|nr:ribonuclease III [Desulfamplus sp.]